MSDLSNKSIRRTDLTAQSALRELKARGSEPTVMRAMRQALSCAVRWTTKSVFTQLKLDEISCDLLLLSIDKTIAGDILNGRIGTDFQLPDHRAVERYVTIPVRGLD